VLFAFGLDDTATPRIALLDLSKDPSESNNHADQNSFGRALRMGSARPDGR
jgi:hypothetical protein